MNIPELQDHNSNTIETFLSNDVLNPLFDKTLDMKHIGARGFVDNMKYKVRKKFI
jgi:hypothetical protein